MPAPIDGGDSSTLHANGLNHHVIQWGPQDAPQTVLLLHGFLDLAFSFAALASQLAAHGLRVIAPDLRGHGHSDWIPPGGYYYFPDYVRDLHALIPQLSTQKLHVVGHSMGGAVATLFAALHQAQVRTLTLAEGFGPAHEQPQDAPGRMQRWLSDVDHIQKLGAPKALRDLSHAVDTLHARHPTVSRAFLETLAPEATRETEQGLIWGFDPLHRTRSPVGLDAPRFAEFARAIAQPTLLIQAEHGMRWGDEAERFTWFTQGQSAQIQGAGHMMHWTHANALSALLLDHFKQS
jgi:pimeloyl-ACP methyl ester carboxylesterase